MILFGTAEALTLGFSATDEPWIVSIFRKGGFVMWPILFCSVLAVSVTIERMIFMRKGNVVNPEFLKDVRTHWTAGDHQKALKTCREHDIAMSRIVRAGLLRADMGILEIERAIEGAGSHESLILTANLRWLGALANISTLLGLLGTVTGMIRSFNAIAASGPGNLALISTGISEALIATAAGLAVGIPTFASYHFLRGKADRLVLTMEEISIGFVEDVAERLSNPVSSVAAKEGAWGARK
jgi:biopolymer transport protein ExbB